MNLDPGTMVVLPDNQPLAPSGGIASTLAGRDTAPHPTPSESIVGEPFFWASASVLVNLS